MDTSLSDKISAKLFVGCTLTPEVRMHLNMSESWKQAHTTDRSANRLQELRYKDKDYLGRLFDDSELSRDDLVAHASGVSNEIAQHCEELPTSSICVKVFPQVFLS